MKKRKASSRPVGELFDKFMQDPAFAAEWEAQAGEREIMYKLIEERIRRKKSQKALAQQIGVKASSISRLESGNHQPSLAYLAKVADALDQKIEINLVPK